MRRRKREREKESERGEGGRGRERERGYITTDCGKLTFPHIPWRNTCDFIYLRFHRMDSFEYRADRPTAQEPSAAIISFVYTLTLVRETNTLRQHRVNNARPVSRLETNRVVK